MSGPVVERVAVAVVGGGPAGLTAAAALAGRVDGEVRVIEREADVGGIPRHSHHPGFGVRDLHRFLSGPAYARRLSERAQGAGAVLHTAAMVTGWAGERGLEVTSPSGRVVVQADAVVLATGARERSRAARLIPGDRPDGVWTTGQLQNLVHLHQLPIGRRAVVVGAELVSWSAVMTLRQAGCLVVLMTSEHQVPPSPTLVHVAGRLALGVPVARRTRVSRIVGAGRVRAVEVEQLDTGRRRIVNCDTVILTGDWVADAELARAAGLDLDPSTRAPRVDTALRTSRPGVFAAGNVLHPVDTADVAALDGRQVARGVLDWLRGNVNPAAGFELCVEPPLRWVAPQLVRPGDPPPARGRLLAWSDALVTRPVVEVVQDGAVVARRRLPWPAAPGRAFRVPAALLDGARRDGGTVRLRIVDGSRPR
jgi:thioredoxin reductase